MGEIMQQIGSFNAICSGLRNNSLGALDISKFFNHRLSCLELSLCLVGNTSLKSLSWVWLDLTEVEARTLVASLNQSKVETVTLCRSSTGQRQICGITLRILLDGFKSVRTLRSIHLMGITTDDGFAAGGKMPSFPHLRELQISSCILTEQVAASLASIIGGSQLKSLGLGAVLATNAVELENVWKCMVKGIQSSKTIQGLGLQDISKGHFESLVETLVPRLQTLALVFKTQKGDSCAQSMRDLLTQTSRLTSLTLVGQLGDDGLIQLREGLATNKTLSKLALQCCSLQAVGMGYLLPVITSHPSMKSLTVSYDGTIGFDGLRIMGKLLSESRLVDIKLPQCVEWQTHDDSIQKAQAQEQVMQQAAKALVDAVQRNPRIKVLDIFGNHFPLEVHNAIHFYTTANGLGRSLLSADDDLGRAVWCHVLAKCQSHWHATSLAYFFLRERPTLVQQGVGSSIQRGRKRRRTTDSSSMVKRK